MDSWKDDRSFADNWDGHCCLLKGPDDQEIATISLSGMWGIIVNLSNQAAPPLVVCPLTQNQVAYVEEFKVVGACSMKSLHSLLNQVLWP